MPKTETLKAYRLLAGGHVGPDYTQDPVEVDAPTPADPARTRLEFPPKMFKAASAGSPRMPGDSDVVYSTADLSEKHNSRNSTKFVALGDAPKDVAERFATAAESGNLSPRQGGPTKRSNRLPVGSLAGSLSQQQNQAGEKDPHDLTPEGEEGTDLEGMTVADLRAHAEEKDIELPSRATKDEIIETIRAGKK